MGGDQACLIALQLQDAPMPYAVAVDIGGTFTDLVAYDRDGHRVAYAKSRPPITISSPESSTGSTR